VTAAARPLLVTLRREAGRLAAACSGGEPPVAPQRFEGLGVAETVRLVPLIWNVCAAAQEGALRAALGLPVDEALRARILADALRDHVLHLAVHLPGALGLPRAPEALHALALGRHEAVGKALLGGPVRLDNADDLASWADAGQTATARSVRALLSLPPGTGGSSVPLLPHDPDTALIDWDSGHLAGAPVDCGAGGRCAGHPLMTSLEARRGRDLAWRTAARLIEVDALLSGASPAPVRRLPGGVGAAFAARGTMLVLAAAERGLVTRFRRLSPTDCAATPGGPLEMALASLPADASAYDRAEIVLAVFDLCVPVTLECAPAAKELADA
jgi:hypothetical protein